MPEDEVPAAEGGDDAAAAAEKKDGSGSERESDEVNHNFLIFCSLSLFFLQSFCFSISSHVCLTLVYTHTVLHTTL